MDPIENNQIPLPEAVPVVPQSKPNIPIKKMLITGCLIGIVLFILFGFQLLSKSNMPTPPISANPTLVPTPTPNRTLSTLATQSSFLALEQNVASLSSAIINFIIEDPGLSPPVLELSLGF